MTYIICPAASVGLEWPILMVNDDVKMGLLKECVLLFRPMLIPKVHLVFEDLALRQQSRSSGAIKPGLFASVRHTSEVSRVDIQGVPKTRRNGF